MKNTPLLMRKGPIDFQVTLAFCEDRFQRKDQLSDGLERINTVMLAALLGAKDVINAGIILLRSLPNGR
jgi:hypothetical protein